MTHSPARRDCTPAEAIAHALDDHWLTTPPGEPIYHTQAAEAVLDHLNGHGYTIASDTPRTPVPSLRTITTTALITLATAASAIAAAIRTEWAWAGIGVLAAAFLGHETLRDLRDRRRRRPAR
ncbi:hypothetical protein ACIQJT_02345 [Streptomyces sp. NPDC091972]|uniref:hypothetical protein n=1 Tax=Streptomyces sp. NPDC091972 TaxID=3366007 RepID=UPI00380DC37B